MEQHRRRIATIALTLAFDRERVTEGILFGALMALILFAPIGVPS